MNWAAQDISDSLTRDAVLKIAAELAVMIVTGQVASAGVSALRGFALAREAMLAGEIMGEARSAGLGFAALEVVTHAGMITVAQGAMGGKMGPREFAENAIGIAMSDIAMRPFAKLFKNAAKVEEEIRTFAQLAKRSGRAALRGGIDLGVNVAVAGAAHYVTHFDQFEMASRDEWVTQAFGLLASKFVHERTAGMQRRIEHAAKASGTKSFEGLQKKVALLEAQAAKGSKATTPETAAHLVEQSHALLVEEKMIHEQLADATDAKAVDAELNAISSEFAEVPFRLAGLKPVVDGEIYAGTTTQIDAAVESARKMGVKVEEVLGTEKNTRKLAVGEREITVHVEDPHKSAPKRTVDDFLGTPADAAELAHAHEQAAQESSKTLAEQAESIRLGHARSEREMLVAAKKGEVPRYIARVSPADGRPTFANAQRPFAFATEPTDLRGISAAEALWKVGWTEEWIEKSIGKEIEVTVFDTNVAVSGASADNAPARVDLGRMGWPELKRASLADPRFVEKAQSWGIPDAELAGAFDRTAAIWEPGADGSLYPPETRLLLDALNNMYSVNRLYTGVGVTMTEASTLGGREVMVQPNGTGLLLTAQNHQKVSLGVLSRAEVEALFPVRQPPRGSK